jgi:hypothetical protein
MRLIQFSKLDMNRGCDALGSNLEADGLVSWIEADVKTLVLHHHSEEYITTTVKSGKISDEPGASDTGNYFENSSNDSYGVVVLKLNEVLESIAT